MLKLKLKLIPRPGRTLLAISLLSPLSHAADVPAAAGHYLTLYAAPGVPQDDDPYTWSTAGGKQLTKGVTKADGRAYVKGEEGEDTYMLKTVSMRWQLKVPAACWQGAPDAFQQCMQLTRTTSRHDEEQDARKLASLLSPLCHAADAPAATGHYLTLYAVPGVPQDDDPYTWSTAGGKQLTKGVTKADGRAYVKGEEGEDTYMLKTVSMRWQLKVPAACWQGAPDAFQQCMQLTRTTSRHDEEQDARKLAEQQKEVKMHATGQNHEPP